MNILWSRVAVSGLVMKAIKLVAALMLLLVSANVWAIPSPDLVINLTASLAQVLGMASVLVGGFFVSRKKPVRKNSRGSSAGSKAVLGGVAAILVISAALNIWQYARQSDIRSQQLSANLYRKAVENNKEVGGVSLQTLSASEQIESKRGISTLDLSILHDGMVSNSILEPSSSVTLVDVREDEEVESGRIPGALHIRYPDLLQNPDLLKGRDNVVLLCYSGNRSSELTGALAERGLETKFMVGGYEKWMAEDRVLDVVSGSRETLRDIPEFENRDVLLETTEVVDLVQNEDAIFIDVRYPAEYQTTHLPGAINLTVRAEESKSLQRKIAALPDKPIIGVCYDRRSCFYSQILGLKISRQGYQFAGRYTVPHEFSLPASGGGKQYVADWNATNQASLLGLLRLKIGERITSLVGYTGSVIVVLTMIVLALRFLLFPLSLKMERDRLVLKRLDPAIRKIKKRFASDLGARGAATSQLHADNKITPVVSLIASLLNLVLMFLMFNIVSEQANNWNAPLLWVSSASLPDQLGILPAVIAVLIVVLAVAMYRPLTKIKVGLIALGTGAISVLVIPLSVALGVYLVLSLAAALVQMLVIAAIDRHMGWSRSNTKINKNSGIIPLKVAHQFPLKTGKKAARLGELMEAGYNVPDGFVVTTGLASELQNAKAGSGDDKALWKAWGSIKAKNVAVRSSGVAEDGDDASFAGVYDSILNVTRDNLSASVATVCKSLDTGLKSEYARKQVLGKDDTGGGILVQKMVDAEYAGVLFTEHPSTAGKILVEMIAGLGEDLVSGSVTPTTHEFGRRSLLAGSDTPFDMTDLLKTAINIEKKFGKPQDIEWAYKSGKFYILQARDITRSVTRQNNLRGLIERERSKVLCGLPNSTDNDAVLEQNELSELLPRPTPISMSFMQKLWDLNGSTHIACERLGIPYKVNSNSPLYVNQLFGWLYVNKQEERNRLKTGPGALASFKLSRDAQRIADDFEQNFLPDFKRRMDTLVAVDFERLPTAKLVSLFAGYTERFVTDTYVEAEVINICNQFYWNAASNKLASSDIDPMTVMGTLPENVVSEAMNLLSRSKTDPSLVEDFIALFGHRAPTDYEFSHPRYCEDEALVKKQIENLGGKQTAHTEPVKLNDRILQISVDRAKRYQALKEEAKHQCLREFYLIRKVLLALDDRCEFNGGIFHLDCHEIELLADVQYLAVARQLIRIRQAEAAEYETIQPPARLTLSGIEEFDPMSNNKQNAVDRPDSVFGTRVAGAESVSGVVHVIRDESEVDKFREGEILVARMTDPSWYPLFPLAKGIITEVGGWLSHAAIVAREYDLPATVGVEDATQHLRSGDIVRMHTDGTIERLANRREPDSPMRVSVPAAVEGRELANQIITDPKVSALPVRDSTKNQAQGPSNGAVDELPKKSGTDQ